MLPKVLFVNLTFCNTKNTRFILQLIASDLWRSNLQRQIIVKSYTAGYRLSEQCAFLHTIFFLKNCTTCTYFLLLVKNVYRSI